MLSKKKLIRVLHLASFLGNIGDLINHAGAYRMFDQYIDYKFKIETMEIREFYWKKRAFDADFIDYANTFDLLIIGGGNYFELWVDHSSTGTSIDISPEQFIRLKVPTLFFALGVDTGQGCSSHAASNFSIFMDSILSREDMFVCVRNDGSKGALQRVLGVDHAVSIPVIPDGGFFAPQPDHENRYATDRPRIGLNIAGDMLERRFDKTLSPEGFLQEIALVCCGLMDAFPDVSIDIVPHIWRDVSFIAQLLPLIPDQYLRRRVTIHSLEPRIDGLNDVLRAYSACDAVLGMRFHANVCPIGMGIPTRGLLNYPQVQYLYEELKIPDRVVDVRIPGFKTQVIENVTSDLLSLSETKDMYRNLSRDMYQQAEKTFAVLNRWMHRTLG